MFGEPVKIDETMVRKLEADDDKWECNHLIASLLLQPLQQNVDIGLKTAQSAAIGTIRDFVEKYSDSECSEALGKLEDAVRTERSAQEKLSKKALDRMPFFNGGKCRRELKREFYDKMLEAVTSLKTALQGIDREKLEGSQLREAASALVEFARLHLLLSESSVKEKFTARAQGSDVQAFRWGLIYSLTSMSGAIKAYQRALDECDTETEKIKKGLQVSSTRGALREEACLLAKEKLADSQQPWKLSLKEQLAKRNEGVEQFVSRSPNFKP